MSSITNPALYSGQYYPLSGSDNSGSGGTSNNAQAGNITSSLIQALTQSTQPAASTLNPADIVDLSPQAQSILQGFGLNGNGSASSAAGGSNGFLLSAGQQQQITSILDKYKDAPFTQATYNQIQDDLKTAGLSPDKLAIQQQVSSFNATSLFIDALNGTDISNMPGMLSNSAEQGNANSYMQQIMGQWQSISSTVGSTQGSDAVSAVSSA